MAECNEIGARIKELREKNGMTQTELASKLFTSRETVNMWERGARDIKTGMIVALAEALQTTCDYILCGIDSNNIGIRDDIGLSNEAINFLRALHKNASHLPHKHQLRAINNLLTPDYCQILEDIYDYLATDFENPITLSNLNEDGTVSSSAEHVVFLQTEQLDNPLQKSRGYFMEIDGEIYENAFLARLTDKMKLLKYYNGNIPRS